MNVRVNVILDTDIDTDCDDAGTLALLHTLCGTEEAKLLAVVCDAPTRWGAPCIDAINRYYGRGDIPVGALICDEDDSRNGEASRFGPYRQLAGQIPPARRYNKRIAENYPNRFGENGEAVPEAVALYRQLLAEHTEVVICAVGLLTVLSALMKSGPDAISGMSGMELIRRSVKRLVVMGGGTFPEGEDAFNWKMDPEAAENVLNRWPGPLSVSSAGETILTGARLMERMPPDHPIKFAYEAYLEAPARNRSSWDQVTALYAVRGGANLFEVTEGYSIYYDAATNRYTWSVKASAPEREWIWPALPDEEIGGLIEELMMGSRLT
ncbi:nucleoside hydrolase [Paenibacillus agaridevorans]|uniref:nucleoside hydrolase n=1 Tax=Paenibacillus agaridevorans TaxID=171404 RepID=UPI001BE3D9E9|nr:nucleoside hydrolase [Paenibacillus agaridevorans]